MKMALFFAVGMVCFLIAGSLVHFFPKQYTDQPAINKSNDLSVQELYRDLAETKSDNHVSAVMEFDQYNSEVQRIKTEVDDRWVLYVTGCVKNPGVYRLPEGARVFQLVEAAGGLNMVADVVAVNMAAQLRDGDHLHIPQVGDDDSVRNRNRSSGEAYGAVVFAQGGQTRDGAVVRNQRANPHNNPKIDINTASAAELQTLPGVGPALASRIIQHRNQNGRFRRVSDLINVSGIGGKKLEAIEPLVFVR